MGIMGEHHIFHYNVFFMNVRVKGKLPFYAPLYSDVTARNLFQGRIKKAGLFKDRLLNSLYGASALQELQYH